VPPPPDTFATVLLGPTLPMGTTPQPKPYSILNFVTVQRKGPDGVGFVGVTPVTMKKAPPFACKECGDDCINAGGLTTHMMHKHKEVDMKQIRIDAFTCGARESASDAAEKHEAALKKHKGEQKAHKEQKRKAAEAAEAIAAEAITAQQPGAAAVPVPAAKKMKKDGTPKAVAKMGAKKRRRYRAEMKLKICLQVRRTRSPLVPSVCSPWHMQVDTADGNGPFAAEGVGAAGAAPTRHERAPGESLRRAPKSYLHLAPARSTVRGAVQEPQGFSV
jgi:hypothetical protein